MDLPILGSFSSAGNMTWSSAIDDSSQKFIKPYTISKSRDRFIEALHLFNRDLKNTEASIGSKTVIQIRTHPQKHKPPMTWRLGSGAKGFASAPKDGTAGKRSGRRDRSEKPEIKNNGDDGDDKIPEAVWQRMISRILFYVGAPMAIGLGFLQFFSVVKERELWDVPKWLPFVTSLVSFGSSALGIAYGSLSTSLDENEEGSLLGFEQVEKNWVEVWKEEEEEEGDK